MLRKLYRKRKSAASMLLVLTMLLQLAPVAYAASDPVTVMDGDISITSSASAATTTVANNEVIISLKGDDYTRVENIVTIQNQSGSAAELSFNYALSAYYEMKLDGEVLNNNAGSVSKLLENEATVTISYKLNRDSSTTSQLVLSNFELKEEVAEAGIILDYDSELGSVTSGDAVMDPGSSLFDENGAIIPVTAVPNEDTVFLGWVDTTTDKLLSEDETYTHVATGDTTIMPAFARADKPAWFSACGLYYVNDLQEANDYAAASPNKNYTVVLLSDGILEGVETGTKEYTIDSGVQLLIPFDEAHTATFNADSNAGPGMSTAECGSSQYAFRTLTLEKGANLICEGQICVNGQLFEELGHYTGVPTGPYGCIELNEGASLVVDGGTLYCYGYIIGDGEVIANSGTLYEVFQLSGWRGGSATGEWAKQAGITRGGTDNIKSFAFNDYTVQNIETNLTINKGATAKGIAAVSVSVDEVITKKVAIDYIGTGTGLVQLQSEDASVIRSLDPATGQVTYILNGTVLVDGITLTLDFKEESWFVQLAASALFGSTSLNMQSASHILAIPGNMSFVAADGSYVTLKNTYKLVPGATVEIEEGATAEVDGTVYIYDVGDYRKHVGKYYPTAYIATTESVAADLPKLSAASSAQIIVDGELIIDGALYTTENGGTSMDKVLQGSGKIINNSTAKVPVIDVLDEYTYSSTTKKITDSGITVVPVVGQIAGVSVDDEYHSFANAGATYYGTGDGYWYQHAVSADTFENIKNIKNLSEEVTAGVPRNRKVPYGDDMISNVVGFISDYLKIDAITEDRTDETTGETTTVVTGYTSSVVTTPFTFTVDNRTAVEADAKGNLSGKGTAAEPYALTVAEGNTVLSAEANVAAEGELLMKYDDHLDISRYEGNVEIIDDGQPTSYQVGYGVAENQVPDTAVVAIEGNYLVATGIGTATVRLGDEVKTVEVTAAPISMLFLGGQSNMQGSRGDGRESIVCPEGMVYGTYGDRYGMSATNATQYAPSALTGPNSLINTTGGTEKLSDYPVMMHNAGVATTTSNNNGKGKNGPDSGFAYQWVESTGEKVWVINAAHGGSALSEWVKGGTQYKEAVALFQACQETMQKEIAAGHYTLSHMGFYWCQGESDSTKTAEYYATNFLSMYEDLKADLSADMDSNPNTPEQTIEFTNIVLTFAGSLSSVGYRYDAGEGLYTAGDNNGWRTHEELEMRGQRVAQLWLGANPDYPDINVVCNIADGWYTMPADTAIPNGTLSVTDYFQKHYEGGVIDYPTHVEKTAAWRTPDGPEDVRCTSTDGAGRLHYNQRGFNEIGREAVRNTMILLGYAEDPEEVETEVTFYDWTGYREVESIKAATSGQSSTLVVPVVSPIYRSKDVTYTTSDGVDYVYYDLVAESKGTEGTLRAIGANPATVDLIGREPGEYRWDFNDNKFESTGLVENTPHYVSGSVKEGVFNNIRYTLDDPVVLKKNENWLVEMKMVNTWEKGVTKILANNGGARKAGDVSIAATATGIVFSYVYENGGSHTNKGVGDVMTAGDTTPHIFRLYNQVSASTGKNQIYFSIDGGTPVAMDSYVNGQSYTIASIGNEEYPLTNGSIEYIYIKESGATQNMHIHQWGEWEQVSDPTYLIPGKMERVCACGATESKDVPYVPYTSYRWELLDGELVSTGSMENHLTLQKLSTGATGSINLETGIFTNVIYAMQTPIQLKQTEEWSVEFEMIDTWTSDKVIKFIGNNPGAATDGEVSIGLSTTGITICTYSGGHVNYGASSGLTRRADSTPHKILVYNTFDEETNTNQLWLSVDDGTPVAFKSGANGRDFTFGYIGNSAYPLTGGSIRYIEVKESGVNCDHTYDDGVVTTDPTCTVDGVKTFTCSICGNTYTEAVGATGHSYQTTPVWTWTGDAETGYTAATASFPCVCGDSRTEPAVVTSAVTVEPTKETEGTRVYTATVTYNEASYTDEKSVAIPVIEEEEPEQPAVRPTYRWELQGTALVDTGKVENGLTLTKLTTGDNKGALGTIDAETGIFTNVLYKLADPIVLKHDEEWSVEIVMRNTWAEAIVKILSNNGGARKNGDIAFAATGTGMCLSYVNSGLTHDNKYVNGLITKGDTTSHSYRIYNTVNAENGTNQLYLSFDGGEGTPITTKAANEDYTIVCIGDSQYELTGGRIDSISIEVPGVHAYGEPTWTWTEDAEAGYTATATAACECGAELPVEAAVTCVTTAPTTIKTGKAVYTATATINEVTYTATKTVEIPAIGTPTYRWELQGTELVNTGKLNNALISKGSGSIDAETGIFTNVLYQIENPIELGADDEWAIEIKMVNTWEKAVTKLLANQSGNRVPGDMSLAASRTGLCFSYVQDNPNKSHDNRGASGLMESGDTTPVIFRVVRTKNSETRAYETYLTVKGDNVTEQTVQMNVHEGLEDYIFRYIGNSEYPLSNGSIEYISIRMPEKDPIVNETYRWDMTADGLESTGEIYENELTMKSGGVIDEDGKHQKVMYTLGRPIILKPDKDWVVEFTMANDGSFAKYQKLFAENATAKANDKAIMSGIGSLVFGEYRSSSHYQYGMKGLSGKIANASETYKFRLENQINDDNTNTVYLYIDDVLMGAMDDSLKSGDNTQNWINNKEFVFRYLGQNGYELQGLTIGYIRVQESSQGHVHKCTSVTTAPTCTETGYTTYTCIACDHSYVGDQVGATGHSYDDGVVTTEPTCTEPGVKTFTCGCGHSYTESIDALNHNLVDVDGQDATCTVDGYTAHKACSRCDYVEGKDILTASGHSYTEGEWSWTGNSTDGYTAASLTFTCACGDSHSQTAALSDRITLEPTVDAEGVRTYTATVIYNELTYTDEQTVTIPKLEEEEPVEPAGVITDNGRSLSLSGLIYINQYVKIHGFEGVDVEKNGGLLIWKSYVTEEDAVYGTADVIREGLIAGNGEYAQQSHGIPAKEYADTLYLRVYIKDNEGNYVYSPLKEYSVRQYCESRIEKTEDEQFRKTCVQMLHYGTAAQKYFKYNTEDLANKNIVEKYPSVAWDASYLTAVTPANTKLAGTGTVKDNGKSLSFSGMIVMNFYFGVEDIVGTVKTAEVLFWDGVEGELTMENISSRQELMLANGEYAVQYKDGFAAKEYEKTIYARAHFVDEDGTEHYSDVVEYSPEVYAKGRIDKSTNPDMVALAKAMVLYGEAAKAYFD